MHQSTSSQGDSPAKTSAQPGAEPELTATGRVFGLSSLELLGSYDPDTSSLKTVPSSDPADSTQFLDRLPRSGMMRSGIVYQREPSVPLTRGTASGLLPTPTAQEYDLWPTVNGNHNRKGASSTSGDGLSTAVKKAEKGEGNWPTPNARDYKGPPGRGSQARGGRQSSLPAKVRDRSGPGPLNPTFLEWLMGFPIGWTESKPSETP